MNDCIQNSDQPTSNPILPPHTKVQALVRSSSAGSSSSFDSCSDLLGSLEHAEESLDDSAKLTHTEHQEDESKCGEEDDVVCDQTLQSENASGIVALDQCRQTEKEELLSLMPLEVKDDGVNMEVLSVKDHIYGLSTAISFSKVRSLAENTVERFSQLQTSFRLPTSYMFPLKHVVPAYSTPPPPDADAKADARIEASSACEAHTVQGTDALGEAFDAKGDARTEALSSCEARTVQGTDALGEAFDAKADAQTEASSPCEAHTVQGTDALREACDVELNTERVCLMETGSVLPKALGNAEHMACGDLGDESCHNLLLDDTQTEGFASKEVLGVMEQISKTVDRASPSMENVFAPNSTAVIGTNDMSPKDPDRNNCMLAGDSVRVISAKETSRNDEFGNTSMLAGDFLPLMCTNNVPTKDTVGDASVFTADSLPLRGTINVSTNDTVGDITVFAADSMPVVESINMSTNDGSVNLGMFLGDSMGTTTEDAFRNNCMVAGDSMLASGTSGASTIDVCGNDNMRTGKLKLVTGANDMPTTLSQNSKHSDLNIATREASLNVGGVIREYTKEVSGGDSDLQQLEKMIISFDLHKKSSALCHPLRTLSSGSGRPDLEEVDDEQCIAYDNKQSFDWNLTSANTGMLSDGQPFELFDSVPNFAVTLSSVDLHARVDHEAYMRKGKKWYLSPDHETSIPKGNPSSSSCSEQRAQVVRSSALSSMNEGRELLWNGQALEGLESDFQQNFSSEEQSCGDILHEERWKGLRVQLESADKREEKEDLGPDELFRYVENLELNEAYVDTVLDMEDVLLDYDENGSRERFLMASSNSVIGTPHSSRDGSLSSSTSGLHLLTSGECTPFTVDWVEVIGAKQRKGGSSFGERIVGVKDHTVYCIKVSSGSQEWEVLRRYRDFVDLYHQLRRKFNDRMERSLPSPWKEVDRDSRKVFGSTHPNIIEVRSSRIEKCLQSLLQAGPPLSTSPPLYWFLCPQSTAKGFFGREGPHSVSFSASQKGLDVQLGMIESPYLQSPRSEVGSHRGELDHDRSSLALGKTVKLNLKIHPNKSLKQLLSAQHHSCAGCDKHLDVERGLVQGFVQTLGWGKPRLCEYSGQLYCTSCHLNETAVLPAQVLWHWDFTPRRVSQLAKAYLDSIYDQPMLCVSAVNPYLYSRVPTLSHVRETRRKLSKMLSCMLCPSRARIFQTMASRWYLLENNDFFALRDLEDVSKGAFAVLPGLLTAVMESLKLHITKQCTVCSETGEWCGAGILCEDPFSPIFPFQEENMSSCKVCHAPFHKACFLRSASCPACPKDQSKRSELAGEFENTQMEELADDHMNALPLLDGQDVSPSSSLLVGVTDLQGQINSDKLSQSYRNWPSFYNLLPKKRLW